MLAVLRVLRMQIDDKLKLYELARVLQNSPELRPLIVLKAWNDIESVLPFLQGWLDKKFVRVTTI